MHFCGGYHNVFLDFMIRYFLALRGDNGWLHEEIVFCLQEENKVFWYEEKIIIFCGGELMFLKAIAVFVRRM